MVEDYGCGRRSGDLRGTAAPAALALRELRGAHLRVGPLEGPRRMAVVRCVRDEEVPNTAG